MGCLAQNTSDDTINVEFFQRLDSMLLEIGIEI